MTTEKSNEPENLIILSSPIMISSMRSQCPSLTRSGRSKVEQISPPRTSASLSTPSKSACSIAMTPASANSCSGQLQISCLEKKYFKYYLMNLFLINSFINYLFRVVVNQLPVKKCLFNLLIFWGVVYQFSGIF